MTSQELVQALNKIAREKNKKDEARKNLKLKILSELDKKSGNVESLIDNIFSSLDAEPPESGYDCLLPLCELLYLFEQVGDASDHARKLSVVFKDLQSSLVYLSSFKAANSDTPDNMIMHNSCLFGLPENIDEKNFEAWRNHAIKFMKEKKFRMLFEHASSIGEKLGEIRKSNKGGNNKIAAEKNRGEIEKKLTEAGRELKILSKKDSSHTTAEEDDKITELVGVVAKLKIELAEACAGMWLKNLNLVQLDAIYEKYKYDSQSTYKLLIEAGVTEKKIKQFSALIRKDDDAKIPDIVINGEAIGHPGYYLRKLHVLEDNDAALGAVLGRKTDCCQSLTGEVGESCTIYGLTSPESGFYLVFKGDARHPKPEDVVVGQTWVWRSQSEAIVFDSIELSDRNVKKIIKDFYENLAIQLVDNNHTEKVVCGGDSGISNLVGVETPTSNTHENFKDYKGYCDSHNQRVIVDRKKMYFRFGENKWFSNETKKSLNRIFETNTPLRQSQELNEIINFALLESNPALLDAINEMAKNHQREDECNKIQSAIKEYMDLTVNNEPQFRKLLQNENFPLYAADKNGNSILMRAISHELTNVYLTLIDKGADVNAEDRLGNTALMHAANIGMSDACLALIEKSADLNAKNIGGVTALMFAAMSGQSDVCLALIEKDADVNAENNEGETALMFAAMNGQSDVCLALIEKGADVNVQDKADYTILMMAARNGLSDVCLALIEKGADVNLKNNADDTALMMAVNKGRSDVCLALIEKGADVNVVDRYGNTALMMSVNKGLLDVCLALLEKGANYDDTDRSRLMENPQLHSAIENAESVTNEHRKRVPKR